jgi:hypothetical protein
MGYGTGAVCYTFYMRAGTTGPEGNEMKTTYTATAADGRTFTRTSARTYTHASIVTLANGGEIVKFASREDLAYQAAEGNFSVPREMRRCPEMVAEMQARRAGATIEIVEVTS